MQCRQFTVGLAFYVSVLLCADVVCAQFREQVELSDIHWATRFPESSFAQTGAEKSSDVRLASIAEQLSGSNELATPPISSGTTASTNDSARWSITEAQFQYGYLRSPSFASGQTSWTKILTLQHASGWKYGDNFFFVDIIDDAINDGFNDNNVYLEWYANFSLGKILGRKVGRGLVSDVGFIAGINYAADSNYRKYLPGIRLSWDLPGFRFFNTDFTAFLDGNAGLAGGGAPAETDSFMIDFNWARPFSLGKHDFSIEGHVEFIGARKNEFGEEVSWWILGQPQFRYDLGKTLFHSPQHLYVGIEWQLWPNKLGDSVTNENAVQALVVWRF